MQTAIARYLHIYIRLMFYIFEKIRLIRDCLYRWLGSAITRGRSKPNPNPTHNRIGLAIAAPSYSGPSPPMDIDLGLFVYGLSVNGAISR